jgi:multidrug efflux system membrane fusion protein
MSPAYRFSRRAWVVVAGIILIAAISASMFFRGGDAAGQASPKAGAGRNAAQNTRVPVDVTHAEQASFPVYLRGLGSIQSFNTVSLRSRVDGEIIKVNFHEGQMVAEGDLLVQIDPRPYQAMLDQAVAKKGQDEALLANAKLDLERYETLVKSSGAASRQQVDTQASRVRQFAAQVAADDAAIRSTQVQLDYTTIRSPIAGRVGFTLATLGNVVHAGDATGIVTITQTDPIAAVFTAPEEQLPAIDQAYKAGPVEVVALSSDGQQTLATGTLAVINNQVDQATGTIQLKATFENAANTLWPGQSVSTQLLLRTLQNVVVIPEDALQRGPNGYFTYVVGNDDKASMKQVKVEQIAGGRAVITAGVQPGERLVVSGQYRLQNGSTVAANDRTPRQTAEHQQAPAIAERGATMKVQSVKD